MPQHTVFFSHAHLDNGLCDLYAKELKKLGLDVWYDRSNMDASSIIPETIANELHKRTALIVMLTPQAVRSKWVMRFEVGAFITFWANAGDEERVILPIMLTDCEVPPILQMYKRIDATLLGQDETIAAIAKALGVEPPAPSIEPPEVEPLRFTLPSGPSISSYWDEYADDDDYDEYQGYGRDAVPSMRVDDRSRLEQMRDMLGAYARLFDDWMAYTEEKWRAVSDSQLGWKPLRGRWNGWEEIYRDSFNAAGPSAQDNTTYRFDNSQAKGSVASAVACFLRDLDMLRQGMVLFESGEQPQAPRTGKAPIIRNPMILDAD